MKTCKTCKHWQAEPEGEQAPRHELDSVVSGGFCLSEFINEEHSYSARSLVYSYSEGGRFWTGPEFGCINHEELT